MNTLNKKTTTISLSDIYDTSSLMTRAAATYIAKLAKNLESTEIALDFQTIDFTSLSFLDQLFHEINNTIGKKMHLINLNDDVKALTHVIAMRN